MAIFSVCWPGRSAAWASVRKLGLRAVGLILFLAACRPAPVPSALPPPATETLAPTETSRFQPYTGPLVRATLPPTWTPTFPPSPAPPTLTPTPTRTPTPAPTLTVAQVCDGFSVTDNLTDGQHLTTADNLTMIFGTTAPEGVIRFLARLRGSEKNLGVQAPGGQMLEMQLALARLPGPGTYDWTLLVHVDTYGDLCRRGGWFVLDAAPTAEATAPAASESATAEAPVADGTESATAEATIPIIYSSDLPFPIH